MGTTAIVKIGNEFWEVFSDGYGVDKYVKQAFKNGAKTVKEVIKITNEVYNNQLFARKVSGDEARKRMNGPWYDYFWIVNVSDKTVKKEKLADFDAKKYVDKHIKQTIGAVHVKVGNKTLCGRAIKVNTNTTKYIEQVTCGSCLKKM